MSRLSVEDLATYGPCFSDSLIHGIPDKGA